MKIKKFTVGYIFGCFAIEFVQVNINNRALEVFLLICLNIAGMFISDALCIGGLAASAVYLNLFDRENENKEDEIE